MHPFTYGRLIWLVRRDNDYARNIYMSFKSWATGAREQLDSPRNQEAAFKRFFKQYISEDENAQLWEIYEKKRASFASDEAPEVKLKF